MRLQVLTDKELDTFKRQVTMSNLPSSTKIDMINAINTMSMQSKDGFTLYQLGYAKGYVAGINAAAGNATTSARESYDAYTRSMEASLLDLGNQ